MLASPIYFHEGGSLSNIEYVTPDGMQVPLSLSRFTLVGVLLTMLSCVTHAADKPVSPQRAVSSSPQGMDSVIDEVRRLYGAGDYKSALALISGDQWSNNAVAAYWQGRLYQARQDLRQAEAAYHRSIALNRLYLDPHLELGKLFVDRGDLGRAINELEEAQRLAGNTLIAAEVRSRLRDAYTKQSTILYDGLPTNPGLVTPAVVLGQKMVQVNMLDETQRLLERVLEQTTDDPQPYYWLGRIYLSKKLDGKGIGALERSVSLAPENSVLRLELAKAYESLGRFENAEIEYRRVIETRGTPAGTIAETDRRLQLILARKEALKGDVSTALVRYQALLKQTPNDPGLLELYARSLERLNHVPEADQVYDRLRKLLPDDAALRLRLAEVYRVRNDEKLMREAYVEAYKLTRDKQVRQLALDGLGMRVGDELILKGEYKEANKIFFQLDKDLPDSPNILMRKAKIYSKLGLDARAISVYDRVLELAPERIDAKLRKAESLMVIGQGEQAVPVLEGLAKLGRGVAEAKAASNLLKSYYAGHSEALGEQISTGSALDAGEVGKAVDLAQKLIGVGMLDAAKNVLLPLTEKAPDARAFYWLGQVEIRSGNRAEGLRYLEKSVALAPDNGRLFLSIGKLHEDAGQWADAEAAYNNALDVVPNGVAKREAGKRLNLVRAQRLVAAGKSEEALKLLNDLALHYPDEEHVLVLKSEALLLLERTAEATALLEKVIELSPRNIVIRMKLAATYYESKEYDKAEILYKQLVKLQPQNPSMHLLLADLYKRQGRFADAADQVSQILKAKTLSEQDRKNGEKFLDDIKREMVAKGKKHLEGGELDEAQLIFESLLRIDPDLASAHYWLAQVFKKRESFDSEVAALEKSLALAPDNTLIVPALANAYVEAGKLDKAADILNKLLDKRPFDFSSRGFLVTIYDKLGQQEKGDDEARMLLEQGAPDEIRTMALNRLGLTSGRRLFKEGEYREALIEFGKVLKVVPNEPVVNEGIAQVYSALGNYDAAIAAYSTAIHEAPEKPNYHIQLAKAYQKAENDEAALNEARLVMSMTVAKKWKDLAKGILSEIMGRQARQILDDGDIDQLSDAGDSRLFVLIQQMLDEALYPVANSIAESLIRDRPDLVTPYQLMGRALIGLKRPTDAVVLLKQALVEHPEDIDIQRVLADAYREANNEPTAILVYEDILRLDPVNAAVALALAELYRERGDNERAREHYARVLNVAKDSQLRKSALSGLGVFDIDRLIQQEQWRDASDAVTALVRLTPNEPEILLRQARIFSGMERFDLAEAEYRRIIGMDANLSEAHYYLGLILAESGGTDDAIKALEVVARKGASDAYSRRAINRLSKIFGAKSEDMVARISTAKGLSPELKVAALDLVKGLYLRLYYGQVKFVSEALLKHGPDAQAYYWLGQAELKQGDRAKGVAAIEQAAALSADNSMLLLKLAEVYESSGNIKKAEAVYRRVAELIPAGPQHDKAKERMFVARARILEGAGENGRALSIISALLKRRPDDVQLLGLMGKVLLALGRSSEADRVFERLVALQPNNVRIRLRMAQLYHDKGAQEQTLNHVKAILQIQPSGPVAVAALTLIGFNEAVALQKKQAWPEALDAFNALLGIIPNNPLVMERIAAIYQETNDLANFERTLNAIIAVEPGNGEALWRLSRLYLQTNRSDQAIAILEAYLSTNRRGTYGKQVVKELADLYRARVRALAQARKYDEAAMVLRKFARENPDNGRAFLRLGLFYAFSGELEQAITALKKATRLLPDDPSAFHQLAVTYAQNSNAMESVASYAKEISLQEDPDKAREVVKDLLFTMARMYFEEDQPVRSIRYLERLRGLGFKDARIQSMLGHLNSQQGELEQAMEVYREGIAINPNDLAMRYSLAGLYEQTNATAAAIAQLRDILKKGKPGDRYVEAARQRKRFLEKKTRRFTSNLGYSLIAGKSVIDEQDVNNTGAANTSFSSSVNYRLTTTFHPSDRANIAVVTGLTHSANHSTQNDSIAPNISFNANLNSPKTFYGFSAAYNESYSLLLDRFGGASANATLSGGLRFNHPVSEFLSLFDFSDDLLPDYFLKLDFAEEDNISLAAMDDRTLEAYLSDVLIEELAVGQSVRETRTFLLHVLSDLANGHPESALQRLAQDRYRIGDHRLVLLLRGWALEKTGRRDDAMSDYLALLERDPSNLWAKYSLGRLYQQTREAEALNWLNAVFAATGPADGLHDLTRSRLRMIYLEDGRRLQGGKMTKEHLAEFYRLIQKLYGLGGYAETLPLLAHQVDGDRNDLQARLWAGRFALSLGRYDTAADYLEQAVSLDGGNAFAHRALGDAYLALGRIESADEAYTWVAEHSRDEAQRVYAIEQLPFGLDLADGDKEDRQQRKQVLEDSLQAHPDDLATILQIADLDVLLGENEQAVGLYRQAGMLLPQDQYISWRLIEAKPREAEQGSSRTSLRSLMSLSDDHWFRLRVLRALGLFNAIEFMTDEDFEQAKDVLEKARAILPDDPLLNMNLALVYRRLEDNAKAKGILESILEAHPDNLTALWLLGDLNIGLRSLDKGMTQLEQVVTQGGDRRVAQLAKDKLQELEEERFAFLTGTPEEGGASTKTLSSSLSMGKSFPLQTNLAQTQDASFNLSLQLPSVTWGTVTLGYGYTRKFNEDLLGTDYASQAHRVSLNYNRPIPGVPRLTGGFSISHQQADHDNYDTSARFSYGVLAKRRVVNDSVSANLGYQLADQLSLSLAYSQSKTRSNLPVGVVHRPDGVRIAFQSLALGDFSTQSLNLSLSFRF